MNEIDVSKCDFYDKNKKYCLTLKMNTTGFKNPSCFSGDFQECIQDSKVCPNTFCDNNHNCYYKQLQQLKQENEKLKEKINENNYCYNELLKLKEFFFNKSKTFYNCLDDIEEIAKDFHLSMIIFHKGTTHEMADRIDDYLDRIKQLIKQAKEGRKE